MADLNSNLPTEDTADGLDGSTAPTYTIQVGGKDTNGNLQTIFTDTTGKIAVNLNDGSGNSITSINNQIENVDIINTSITSGSITVGTTAVALRVGSSNLTNRKMLMFCPTNGVIYLGATSGVTTATGIPFFPNNPQSFSWGAGVTPYAIAAASVTTIVLEGS